MLKFITTLEFMYKIGILVGMVVSFWIFRTAQSLIIGQIVALSILIPIEYLLVNQRLLKDHWMLETIVTMLPSFFISAIIIFDQIGITFGLGLITVLVYYLYYLNKKRFKIKLLLE